MRWFIALNERQTSKKREWVAIMSFSADIPLSFKLSSFAYTAYRAPVGHAGLRGPAVRSGF
jgi:hypothetical protein